MAPQRRAVLAGGLALTTALAGCANRGGLGSDGTGAESSGPSGTVSEPPVSTPRNPDNGPVVVDADGHDDRQFVREFVGTADRAASLEFADAVPDDHVDATRTFLEETDFDEATVFVTERGIASCSRYRLRSVSWSPGRVEFEYCSELRAPDETCVAGRRETLGLFVRIPAVLERDLTGTDSSGPSSCRSGERDWETIDGNDSEASDT
ncbi:hypothetical protein NP511_15355 [Natrinema thermotolerans]|uniref:Lipoprotein n=1 Tax=Natrinema thermotolerans TaxID=121872 RepID=A0AAF0P9A1_9EURY|nr:hypothetical protein [Natrinema thermotolerans]QCC59769.1 hypothetical protein DVR14_14490 [Natrinema thermotolerans]WMT06756.1 hypothetical protein NP511_15355 [Natrinema thermotolerans]